MATAVGDATGSSSQRGARKIGTTPLVVNQIIGGVENGAQPAKRQSTGTGTAPTSSQAVPAGAAARNQLDPHLQSEMDSMLNLMLKSDATSAKNLSEDAETASPCSPATSSSAPTSPNVSDIPTSPNLDSTPPSGDSSGAGRRRRRGES
eukprot:TRINITY_DN65116_c0_g1_i1.p1 TRINITY_DN65116_c0_g1~~TRINITY_DN65116_c0_g1_i1.p1  ORF type:complete len:149 (-),score=26.31 TRINITY_DN65116_c0_g1_i1:174-620(-)